MERWRIGKGAELRGFGRGGGGRGGVTERAPRGGWGSGLRTFGRVWAVFVEVGGYLCVLIDPNESVWNIGVS